MREGGRERENLLAHITRKFKSILYSLVNPGVQTILSEMCFFNLSYLLLLHQHFFK